MREREHINLEGSGLNQKLRFELEINRLRNVSTIMDRTSDLFALVLV